MEANATFTLSAFGDEIDADVDAQLRLLTELEIGFLELRSAWGTNVLRLDDDQVAAVKSACLRHSVAVSCIGSPIGKSPILDPIETELANLDRTLQVAEALDTSSVRIFSFYPPEGETDDFIDEAAARLSHMARAAEQRGVVLLLENERDLVGDTPERCLALLEAVDSASLTFVWDTANFAVSGVERPTDRGWPLLGPHLSCVQVKDYRVSDGSICPAGEGDAQVPELLDRLLSVGYQGFLALEPHLFSAGRRGGFSGQEGMHRAASALRKLMADAGCRETKAPPS